MTAPTIPSPSRTMASTPSPTPAPTPSDRLYDEASALIPGGTSRLHYFYPPHPIVARAGRGCRLTDVDGVERLDFLNNMTALIHGHAHPGIRAAIVDQLDRGTAFSEPSEAEVALAREMVRRVDSVERIRFLNSGTEAVMMACKIAREYAGRRRIAKFEGHYHGYYDYMQVSVGTRTDRWGPDDAPASVAMSGGISPAVVEEVLVLPYNDRERTEALLTRHASEVAALIVDPMSNRAGAPTPAPGFLAFLEEITRRHGIVLIYDEVISFRNAWGGAQARYGGHPDLTTYGKLIGGGLPVGAVGGRAEIMALLDPRPLGTARVESGGTYSGNPLTMVAGLAALDAWTPDEVERLGRLGDRLRGEGTAAFREAGEPGQVMGDASLFRIVLTDDPITEYRSSMRNASPPARMAALHGHLMREGIIVGKIGLGCLSTPMGEAEVNAFVDALRRALAALRRG